MIARLSGIVIEKALDHAIIDASGVGYRVYASLGTLNSMPPPGEETVLRIYTNVSETAFDLYGFADLLEEEVFRCLIGAPNIGCRKAIQILSGINAGEIIEAVREGNILRLSKAHGVGKKTAERLIVELKDRMSLISVDSASQAKSGVLSEDLTERVTSGLVGLGFRQEQARTVAEATIRETGGDDLPALLRNALQRLRKA